MFKPTVFRALETFTCAVLLNCEYCEGLTYTVREGNEALAERVEGWLAEGLVELVDDASSASAAGYGEVS